MTDFVMPTSASDVKKIQDAVKEASNAMFRISSEKELIKSIGDKMKEELSLPPSVFNKMVKVYFKNEFAAMTEKAESFADLYESIMSGVDPSLTV